jgi:hypothetical protein
MARVARVVLAAVACWCWSCSSNEPSAQPPPPSAGAARVEPQPLATFPAAGGSSFALVPGTCAAAPCALSIELRSGARTLDSAPLDFAASPSHPTQTTADRLLGAGDLLASRSVTAWTAGDGENSVVTAARTVQLSPQETGLLVSQAGGFEHVKRRHYLFAIVDDRLKRVWTGEEGAGPTWSATVLIDDADGRAQHILHLTGFQPGGSEPDTVSARRYRWDAERKTLVDTPVGPMSAVVVGDFADLDAARAARAQPCLSGYSAVRAGDVGLPGSRIVLVAVTTLRPVAEAALKSADNCAAGLTRRVVDVTLSAPKP